jgi:CheY-like chemotaxis protein
MDSRGHILVVNDDDKLRATLRDILQVLGREIRDTPTGREGLKMCEEEKPALIVLDYNLKKDGLAVTARDFIPHYQRGCAGVPILVVSATDLTIKPEDIGVQGFIAVNGLTPWDTLLVDKAKMLLDETANPGSL